MALELVLGTAIQELLRVIEREREANFRFQSILTNLKSTLDSAFPKISEILQVRESNGLENDELDRLLEKLNQARETVEMCSRVAWWDYCKKRKYAKELMRLDASLKNFFSMNMQLDHYRNITWIQVELRELARRLDRVITRKRNASRRNFNQTRFKASVAAAELKIIVQSLPGWIFHYLRSFLGIPRWGYQRITGRFCENSRKKNE